MKTDIESHVPIQSKTPLIQISYPEALRFQPPPIQSFSTLGSIFSILSLALMTALSSVMLWQLIHPEDYLLANFTWLGYLQNLLRPPEVSAPLAIWTMIPFAFTIFGAGVGGLFELGLLLAGTPFQQTRTPFTSFIQKIRFLNLAPVTGSIFFFVCCMAIPDPNLRMALLYLAAATTIGLGFVLFFGSTNPIVPMILMGIQVLQIIIVCSYDSMPGKGFLIAQAVLQLIALRIGTLTPLRSTIFHTTSTLSGVMLYAAVVAVTAVNPDFSHQVAPILPPGSLLSWGVVVACLAGLLFAVKAFPDSYSNFRAFLSVGIWTPIYFNLVSAARFPQPFNLSKVYGPNPPAKTALIPYFQAHPYPASPVLPPYQVHNLSIPAVGTENLEANVTAFSDLLEKAKKGFALIASLDDKFPQANIHIPLLDKPRLPIWSDGSDFWPKLFQMKLFGDTIPHQGLLAKTPDAALAAFKKGQLLAYLTESGVANTFAKPIPSRGEGVLVSDFRFLEKYATKPDYESYGGMAYFKVNSDSETLDLIAVVAPGSQKEIAANPDDPAFRYAEALILASMYFQVISGKHLAEIHMSYNLVEVAMHDAFDAQGQWAHPFRTFMYLHFFSHELAEEVTTEHLVQEGAVFSQIFATTHNALLEHLNDCYADFEYGIDEDFEARSAAMTIPGKQGKILPNACINWELKYFEIWHKYATDLINIIYADDQAVQADQYLQDFHGGLLQVLLKGLPERYQGFQTKQGVARFAADTIHHAVIRHQVYGTTGIRAALDPRISTTQVPRDSGPPAIDEWRSLAYVALATGEARFTLLMCEPGKDFTYLLEGVDSRYQKPMAKVFDQLQQDLKELDKAWNIDALEQKYNYEYFRAIPSDLRTGPGY